MATNTGQTVRYRILCILEDEGSQGWGDIRTHPKLSKYDADTVQFELANLIRLGHVLDGLGYRLSPRGHNYLTLRRAAKELKETEGTHG